MSLLVTFGDKAACSCPEREQADSTIYLNAFVFIVQFTCDCAVKLFVVDMPTKEQLLLDFLW